MNVFAELLKIPSSSPQVSVTVSSTKEEEGLITEDVSWESLDNERPTAFVIRPAGTGKRLPAVVCLHGTVGAGNPCAPRSLASESGLALETNSTRETSRLGPGTVAARLFDFGLDTERIG
jgi:hypothetical protein